MHESSIRDAMDSYGLFPHAIIIDGKFHRFSTKHGKKDDAGWYIFHDEGDLCLGAFGDHRRDLSVNYSSKKDNELTASERLEYKKKRETLKRKIAAERKKAAEQAAKKAAHIYDNMTPCDGHPYLAAKGIQPQSGIGIKNNYLIVPMYLGGEICNVQIIDAAGQKRFLKGSIKQAAYHIVGDAPESGDVLICEGYATACTLFEATGKAVIVAFDAGNLAEVGKAIKKTHPQVNLIYCADKDDNNIGREKAEAARSLTGGGIRLLPDDFTGGTDFNDYAALHGLQAVSDLIYPPLVETPPEYDYEPDYGFDVIEPPFRVLGRHAGRCYYIPTDGYVYDFAPASHGKQVLLSLAPYDYWAESFANDRGIDADRAASWLLDQSQFKTFDPSTRRGRGAWVDNGRVIVHQGTTILDVASGKTESVTAYKSKYIYPKAYQLSEERLSPATNAEAHKVLEICNLIPLESKMSAYMLAGWVVCAQICGVLHWRPHLWITGRKGSGKSYVMNNLILPLLGKNCLQVQSSTTEAGIRQSLQGDALPVLFDEAEGTGQRERDRLQRVLELARQASSEGGGVIAKGTSGGQALAFHIRSCFCFSSISHSITQNSDRSRVSVIEIDSKRYGSDVQYKQLSALIHDTITPEYCNKFYWRCVNLATVIQANAKVFADAATHIFKDRRAGDQIGALLAGAYSLSSSNVITIETANQWMNDRNEEGVWQPLMAETEEQSDEDSLLASIMQAHCIHDGKQVPIGSLINHMTGDDMPGSTVKQTLATYGIRVERDKIFIANKNDNLRACISHTAFADNHAKALQRLPGAEKSSSPLYFGNYHARATIIPLQLIKGDNYDNYA